MRDFDQDPNEWFGDDESRQENENPTRENTERHEEQTSEPRLAEDFPKESEKREYGYSYPNERPYSRDGKPKKPKNGTSSLLIAFCLVLFIFIGISVAAIFDLGGTIGDPYQTTEGTSDTVADAQNGTSQTGTQKPAETAPGVSVVQPNTDQYVSIFREVANEALKTVVEIYVTSPSGNGAGSGVIYDPNGYIVTNYHVTDGTATSIDVVLYDGTEYEAQFIYGDELADIAVIKIEKTDCDYAVFGDSDALTYGDMVLAIGNPQGLGLSVTDGIISRPGELVTIGNSTMNLLRTSAAINGGNSGGGLFNLNGELVGIVNAKLAASTIDNIGYAIPSSTVVKCINDLKEYGYITGRARLGVTVETKTYTSWPYQYTLLQVKEILANGSAANSGLLEGDILYQYEGTNITSFEILSQQLTKYSVGDTIKLTVLRPTIEYTGSNLQQYINSAQEVEIEITFVEFNPNM
ncbi:MAG: trypsin-like peptidase domain-containing protein [Clostridia bacterium]|nr:trypsin-like peptidase domain-containing protein [Clostridia bacterium]